MNSNSNNINPFDKASGSASLSSPKGLLLLFLTLLLMALLIAKLKIVGIGLLVALLVVVFYLYKLFTNPILGFYTAIVLNFLILGMTRYIKGLPLAFAIDGVMILTFLALIFSRFKEKVDWSPANRDITYLAGILAVVLHLSIGKSRSKKCRSLDCRKRPWILLLFLCDYHILIH